jgi:radical SAM enzyme (TIGR01210 family)
VPAEIPVDATSVRSRRGPKSSIDDPLDPSRPLGWIVERERCPDRPRPRRWLTVFTAGAECPFACVFCDLWQHTLPGPTPEGALPAQLRTAIAAARAAGHAFENLKIYNASNLFEPRAVPAGDDPALVEISAGFERVLVECHPRWLDDRALAFARALAERGSRLDVALGLETVHPEALPKLGKKMTVERFDRAVDLLLDAGCGVRAFVLVGAPFQPPVEAVEWAVRSAVHAARRGVEHVSLIPVRGGNGTLALLAEQGLWRPTRLSEVEEALDRSLAEIERLDLATVVTADTWDLERFAPCSACAEARARRLERINLSGGRSPAVACDSCDGG